MSRFAIPLAAGLVLALGGPAFAIDTPNERVTLAGLGAVHVVVDELLREAPARYVHSVDLTLRQHTRLIRDRAIESYAITWSENRQAGVVDAAHLDTVRDAVRATVQQFVAAWQTVNPLR
ncbi:MAG: hypothetical protein ACREJ9_08360 [Candidatus Rokuibacteriota bacterium]